MTTPTAPKYRTTTRACSCPGFWYRRTCRHYRAYREAVALVAAQNSANVTLGHGKGRERGCAWLSVRYRYWTHHRYRQTLPLSVSLSSIMSEAYQGRGVGSTMVVKLTGMVGTLVAIWGETAGQRG